MLCDLLLPIQELFKDVRRKALMRLEYEGLHNTEAIIAPGTKFHNDPALYAMDRYAYYVCYKCNKVIVTGGIRFFLTVIYCFKRHIMGEKQGVMQKSAKITILLSWFVVLVRM